MNGLLRAGTDKVWVDFLDGVGIESTVPLPDVAMVLIMKAA